jgi:hypothetical protein
MLDLQVLIKLCSALICISTTDQLGNIAAEVQEVFRTAQ